MHDEQAKRYLSHAAGVLEVHIDGMEPHARVVALAHLAQAEAAVAFLYDLRARGLDDIASAIRYLADKLPDH